MLSRQARITFPSCYADVPRVREWLLSPPQRIDDVEVQSESMGLMMIQVSMDDPPETGIPLYRILDEESVPYDHYNPFIGKTSHVRFINDSRVEKILDGSASAVCQELRELLDRMMEDGALPEHQNYLMMRISDLEPPQMCRLDEATKDNLDDIPRSATGGLPEWRLESHGEFVTAHVVVDGVDHDTRLSFIGESDFLQFRDDLTTYYGSGLRSYKPLFEPSYSPPFAAP